MRSCVICAATARACPGLKRDGTAAIRAKCVAAPDQPAVAEGVGPSANSCAGATALAGSGAVSDRRDGTWWRQRWC